VGGHLVYFPVLVCLDQEKSGNPMYSLLPKLTPHIFFRGKSRYTGYKFWPLFSISKKNYQRKRSPNTKAKIRPIRSPCSRCTRFRMRPNFECGWNMNQFFSVDFWKSSIDHVCTYGRMWTENARFNSRRILHYHCNSFFQMCPPFEMNSPLPL
jgi:hypothetical protein